MKFVVFQGGLGNQLFQYGYYLSMLKKYPKLSYQFASGNSHNGFEIDKWFNISMNKPLFLWKVVFKIIYFLKIKGIANFIITEEEYPKRDGCFVSGYWQDKMYISKDFLRFKDLPLTDRNGSVMKEMLSSNSIAIHVRRGDYFKPPYDKIYAGICSIEYYNKSIELVKQKFSNPHFFVFSDDIEWVKDNLKLGTDQVLFVDWNRGNDSVYDMFLMSKAKANIIANSTFSFWGAFLNEQNPYVIYPAKWFASPYKVPDIFPDEWLGLY